MAEGAGEKLLVVAFYFFLCMDGDETDIGECDYRVGLRSDFNWRKAYEENERDFVKLDVIVLLHFEEQLHLLHLHLLFLVLQAIV